MVFITEIMTSGTLKQFVREKQVPSSSCYPGDAPTHSCLSTLLHLAGTTHRSRRALRCALEITGSPAG